MGDSRGGSIVSFFIRAGDYLKNRILNLLKEKDSFISGEDIGEKFNMTRAGIWKHINSLKKDGYIIESISSKGYKLVSAPDILTYEEIKEYLKTSFIGRNIYYYDSIDSTNIIAKEIAVSSKEGTIVVGEEQLAGKGRMGREWISPKWKGIYMSIILKPDMEPMKAPRISLIGAAAVNKALLNLGIKSLTKWPNDILINGKKISGILTEISGELNMIDYLIMGIGVNVNLDKNQIPKELKEKATSINIEEGKSINRKVLMANILNELEDLYIDFKENGDISKSVEICRENSVLIGKEVNILRGKESRKGIALDINKDGELVVEFETGIENIFSGEVSVRGLHGYI